MIWIPRKIATMAAMMMIIAAGFVSAQTTASQQTAESIRVTQINNDGLAKLLKPQGRPLLINFWATWCEPCREEFPDLIRLDAEYRGRVDMITVSMDELSDIRTFVPKFLGEVGSKMPAFLLKTNDEDGAIRMVSDKWPGNLPMTVIYDASGAKVYERNGKVKYETLKVEFEKLLESNE